MYTVIQPVYDKSVLSEYPYIIKDQVEGEDEFDNSSLLAYAFRRNVERRGFRLEPVILDGRLDCRFHKIYKICCGGIPFAYVESFNTRIAPFPEFGVIYISENVTLYKGEYVLCMDERVVSLQSFMDKDPHGPVINDIELQAYLCSLHKKSLKV